MKIINKTKCALRRNGVNKMSIICFHSFVASHKLRKWNESKILSVIKLILIFPSRFRAQNAMGSPMPSMSQPPPSSRTTYRAGPTINQRPQMYTRQPEAPPPKPAPSFEGPVITVFVGNISERAPEPMIKRILAAVGAVINWKRVSTFGFCEYE